MTPPCAECARNALAVHTARVERDHDRDVITALQRQVRDLEGHVKDLEARLAEKGKKK
jgi:hypothetical protein